MKNSQSNVGSSGGTTESHASIGCPECAWGKVAGCWRCGSRAGRHSVMAAYIGPMFCKPDHHRVEISVEKRGSRWAVRSDANGFTTFRRQPTKREAIAAADALAARVASDNERARKTTGATQ